MYIERQPLGGIGSKLKKLVKSAAKVGVAYATGGAAGVVALAKEKAAKAKAAAGGGGGDVQESVTVDAGIVPDKKTLLIGGAVLAVILFTLMRKGNK